MTRREEQEQDADALPHPRENLVRHALEVRVGAILVVVVAHFFPLIR